jgi:hypothetical protein
MIKLDVKGISWLRIGNLKTFSEKETKLSTSIKSDKSFESYGEMKSMVFGKVILTSPLPIAIPALCMYKACELVISTTFVWHIAYLNNYKAFIQNILYLKQSL